MARFYPFVSSPKFASFATFDRFAKLNNNMKIIKKEI